MTRSELNRVAQGGLHVYNELLQTDQILDGFDVHLKREVELLPGFLEVVRAAPTGIWSAEEVKGVELSLKTIQEGKRPAEVDIKKGWAFWEEAVRWVARLPRRRRTCIGGLPPVSFEGIS